MRREQFLQQLQQYLQRLPKNEQQEIMQDYEEYFKNGTRDGKSDEELVLSLGSPKQIANELLTQDQAVQMEEDAHGGSVFRAIFVTVCLVLFNLTFILGPFLGLVGLLVGLWITGIAGIASPLVVLASAIFHPGTFLWFDLFVSILTCGVGLLLTIGMYYTTIATKNVFIRYLKWNIFVVKGGTKHD